MMDLELNLEAALFVSNFLLFCNSPVVYASLLLSSIYRYRLSFGSNDKLQLGALVSTFTNARLTVVAAV